MKAVVVRQPWASLIAHGIKTIETRGFQPLSTLAGGDPLAIVAARWQPKTGTRSDMVGGWVVERFRKGGSHLFNPSTGQVRPCPLGAVVAIVTFDDAVRVTTLDEKAATHLSVFPHEGGMHHQRGGLWLIGQSINRGMPTYMDDQRPLGDFTPGRYGWLLSAPHRLTTPVPCPAVAPDGTKTHMQGVFTLPAAVEEAVTAQLP